MSISRCPLFDCRSKCLLVSLLVCLNGCLGNYASVKSFIYTTLYLVPLRRYSVKDSGIRLNRYLFCDSRSCPNNQSCRNIQQGKTLRFRCPLQSAPVRTDGFFLPRNGCNIAPGTDPAMETVTEDFQNFSQRFFGADFCCRQTTASCTFVCRKVFRHTKGARSARLGGVPESRHLNYQTDDNHEKEDRTPDNDRSQSPQV